MIARIVLLVALTIGCATPPAPPPAPPPSPTPEDLFTLGIWDCADANPVAARNQAQTCADAANTSACMVDYVRAGADATSLACAARDVEVELFISKARGVATLDEVARARKLRAWIAEHGMQYRGAP